MGAFVTYLYLRKGIKNFFVLAPNLTIYKKLIDDFSISTHPKYVFQGIGEFVHNQPVIVTGDNYNNTKLFSGFAKSCHNLYKFDSKTEKDFAGILENDNDVLKWLRPAPNQFDIYWNHNSSRYRPDFVAETEATIYMVETKKEGDIESSEVQEKSQAALEYCKFATEYTDRHGGKPWEYVLIPHNAVQSNMGFRFLVDRFKR